LIYPGLQRRNQHASRKRHASFTRFSPNTKS
jgi:hypothetical protein